MTAVDPIIDEKVQEYETWYETLQSHFKLETHPENRLVTAVSNQNQPIHRWYSLKEGYSGDLPIWIVNHLSMHYQAKIERAIDPFVGGGTTGVSLALNGVIVDGIEYNPFINLVARVKANYLNYKRDEIIAAISNIKLKHPRKLLDIPNLSTFQNSEYFNSQDIQVLLRAIKQIKESTIDQSIKDFLLLGIAAAIEPVSNLRKDGRALRYEKKINRRSAAIIIRENWQKMIDDLEDYDYSGSFSVYQGTAVKLPEMIESETYDLAIYSPPYLNNFDYSEIYKLELWLLGYISSHEQWRELRKSTLRSHPSIKFEEQNIFDQLPMMESIYNRLKDMRDETILVGMRNDVRKIIIGYFEDMYLAFKEQWRVLKPGGFLVYIVANSRHKYMPIATDVVLGEIARLIGFEPLELWVLKKRNGRTRQKAYLRESAVILRKPIE